MNDAEIMRQADEVLREAKRYLNTYHPLAWGIPWEIGSVEKLHGIVVFYEQRKEEWIRMLAGASDIARKMLLEFTECADLEIEAAKSVLFLLQGGRLEERGSRQ